MISLLSSFANLMQNWNPLLVVIIVEIFGKAYHCSYPSSTNPPANPNEFYYQGQISSSLSGINACIVPTSGHTMYLTHVILQEDSCLKPAELEADKLARYSSHSNLIE